MNHIYNLADAHLDQLSLVTIGVFDGVHTGHQHLIKQLVDEARRSGRLAVVLTFFPHPDVVLQNLQGRYYLTTPEQKAQYLSELGVDYVITQPFDDSVRQMRAADFVDQLIDHLKMQLLCVGKDFALGYQREGNVAFLRQQGDEKGFTLNVIDMIASDNGRISSTSIRLALQEGDVGQARAWLGRSYAIQGEVVRGEQRGRTIGFPTANVAAWSEQVIPGNGVYACWAHLGGERFMAVTNIGVRPTFNGQGITVEAHLLDFDRDIYGQQLMLTFEYRLREEKKFNGIQELIAQIGADAQAGREYLTSLERN